jgi:hypothetical protein
MQGGVVNFTPRPPYPLKRTPLTIQHEAGGGGGEPRASLEVLGKRMCFPYSDSNPGRTTWLHNQLLFMNNVNILEDHIQKPS